jgi:hypothetical protein
MAFPPGILSSLPVRNRSSPRLRFRLVNRWEYSHTLGIKECGLFFQGATMDEDHKGCLLIGGVLFFLALCAAAMIVSCAVTVIQGLGEAIGQFPAAFAHSIQAFELLLTCIIELIKYVMTPFVPILNLVSSKQP